MPIGEENNGEQNQAKTHLCEKSQPVEDFARRVSKRNKYNFILWNKELYLSKTNKR